jgi:hypothetical protein
VRMGLGKVEMRLRGMVGRGLGAGHLVEARRMNFGRTRHGSEANSAQGIIT